MQEAGRRRPVLTGGELTALNDHWAASLRSPREARSQGQSRSPVPQIREPNRQIQRITTDWLRTPQAQVSVGTSAGVENPEL